jgi:ribosomal protein L35AE/L33A
MSPYPNEVFLNFISSVICENLNKKLIHSLSTSTKKKKPKTIHGDMTPIHGRVTNIRVRTSVPIGIQQLSQQVQVLINTVLAIQE